MKTETRMDSRYRECLAALEKRGQEHILRWWNELDAPQREQLLCEVESVAWDLLDTLIPSHVLAKPEHAIPADLQPVDVYASAPAPGRHELYDEARQRGRELLGGGRVAALTVAGGQGTRLGFDGPKGVLPVTPVGSTTLFQLFAEMVKAARKRHNAPVPWYVMTSPPNHEQTVEYFARETFFGLPEEDVFLFPQGMLPALDFEGRLILETKHGLALAPDGHGGSLKALVGSGALEDMQSRGVEVISYFQVDNPLVKPFDPLSIGLHAITKSEMSTKVTPKADDFERVGNVCVADGKVTLVEYTDFPDELARLRTEDGRRRFDAANLAVHIIDVAFVERVIADAFRMPYRRAEKTVPFIDPGGTLVRPTRPNAVKLELFVFDALPLARRAIALGVERGEEFSPVKNATGTDTLETAKRDQTLRACRWLEAAGVALPRKQDGQPNVTVAISPLFALDAEEVKAHADELPEFPPGGAVYIK